MKLESHKLFLAIILYILTLWSRGQLTKDRKSQQKTVLQIDQLSNAGIGSHLKKNAKSNKPRTTKVRAAHKAHNIHGWLFVWKILASLEETLVQLFMLYPFPTIMVHEGLTKYQTMLVEFLKYKAGAWLSIRVFGFPVVKKMHQGIKKLNRRRENFTQFLGLVNFLIKKC